MDIKNVTIVTALFDIGRDKWDNFTMSYHTYLHWMQNILYLDTNLIIYTESAFREQILEYRRKIDPKLEKTIIVVQPVEQLDTYKLFYSELVDLMSGEEFKKAISFNVPEMTKPLYNIVMFAKLFYIMDAYHKKLFDTDLYVWLDAGVIRDDKIPDKPICWPNLSKLNFIDNTKPTFFCHHDYVRIGDYKSHALSQTRFIQGGSIFVPSGCVDDLYNEFNKVVSNCLKNKYIGSDEKILDILYVNNSDKYNLIKCGWREYIDLFMPKNISMEVIVSKFKEDISWTKNIKYPVKIYNKNIDDNKLYSLNLPNFGREGHTFFYHIVNNYDNLPEYICFLQGNPFDHCADVLEKINNFEFVKEFVPLGAVVKLPTDSNICINIENYAKHIGFPLQIPVYMVPGGQYIISRRLVHKKPKEYYQKIVDTLNKEIYPYDGLNVEKTLLQIYGLYND